MILIDRNKNVLRKFKNCTTQFKNLNQTESIWRLFLFQAIMLIILFFTIFFLTSLNTIVDNPLPPLAYLTRICLTNYYLKLRSFSKSRTSGTTPFGD